MRGGLESIADMVSAHLSKAGHDVVVLTEAQLGAAVEVGGRRKIVRRPGMIRLWQEFRRADAVLFFGLSIRALPAAIFSGAPLILSHHGVYTGKPNKLSKFLRFMRLLPARCSVNICVSHFVASHIPGRTVVIHNAYDDVVFYSDDQIARTFHFGFCGRLVSEKGVNVLLDAFAELSKNESRLRLVVVGDGPERNALEEQVRYRGIEHNVTFTGSKDSNGVADMMRRCDVLVVPSVCEESFGIVALEALASGCRVVVTRKGGLPEAVGDFGIVVDPTAESLMDGMSTAMKECHSPRRDPGRLRRYLASRRIELVGRRYERVLSMAAGN